MVKIIEYEYGDFLTLLAERRPEGKFLARQEDPPTAWVAAEIRGGELAAFQTGTFRECIEALVPFTGEKRVIQPDTEFLGIHVTAEGVEKVPVTGKRHRKTRREAAAEVIARGTDFARAAGEALKDAAEEAEIPEIPVEVHAGDTAEEVFGKVGEAVGEEKTAGVVIEDGPVLILPGEEETVAEIVAQAVAREIGVPAEILIQKEKPPKDKGGRPKGSFSGERPETTVQKNNVLELTLAGLRTGEVAERMDIPYRRVDRIKTELRKEGRLEGSKRVGPEAEKLSAKIAEMKAAGATNEEIAEAVGLSPKTIQRRLAQHESKGRRAE